MTDFEYTTPNQVNMNFGETFFMTRKAPAIAQRVFDKLERAQKYIANEKGSAVPGLVITVFQESSDDVNGIYFAKEITPSRRTKLVEELPLIYKETSNLIELVKVKADAGGEFVLDLKSTNHSIDIAGQDIQTYGNIIPMGKIEEDNFKTTIEVGGVKKGENITFDTNIYALLKKMLVKVYKPNKTLPTCEVTKLTFSDSKQSPVYDFNTNQTLEVGTNVTNGEYIYKYNDGLFNGNDCPVVNPECKYITEENETTLKDSKLVIEAPLKNGQPVKFVGTTEGQHSFQQVGNTSVLGTYNVLDGLTNTSKTIPFKIDYNPEGDSSNNSEYKCIREGSTKFTLTNCYGPNTVKPKDSNKQEITDGSVKIDAGVTAPVVNTVDGRYKYFFGFVPYDPQGNEAMNYSDEQMMALSTAGAVYQEGTEEVASSGWIEPTGDTVIVPKDIKSPSENSSFVLCLPAGVHDVITKTLNAFDVDYKKTWKKRDKTVKHVVDGTTILYSVFTLSLTDATEYRQIKCGTI